MLPPGGAMGLLQRALQRKSARIDAARWMWVTGRLEPDERSLHNVPARVVFSDAIMTGYLYLTDRSLLFADAPGHVACWPLCDIEMITPSGRATFRVGTRVDGEPVAIDYEMYPSIFSTELYDEFVDLVSALH
jgi:hypothetical protein